MIKIGSAWLFKRLWNTIPYN